MIEVKLKILLLFFVFLLIPFFVNAPNVCRDRPDGWYCEGNWAIYCMDEFIFEDEDCGAIDECSGTCPDAYWQGDCTCRSGGCDCGQGSPYPAEYNEQACTGCCGYAWDVGTGDCTTFNCLDRCCGNDPFGENYWMNLFCGTDFSCQAIYGEIACCDSIHDAVYEGNCYLACEDPGQNCLTNPDLFPIIQSTEHYPSIAWGPNILNVGLPYEAPTPSGPEFAVWMSCDIGSYECENFCGGVWDGSDCSFGDETCFELAGANWDCCDSTETCPGTSYSTASDCPDVCCSVACESSPVSECGNGVTEDGETCDDGNTVTEECAYGLPSCLVCDSDCQEVAGETDYCGDGDLDVPQEQCDDGNNDNQDGCSSNCHTEEPCPGMCCNPGQSCDASWTTGYILDCPSLCCSGNCYTPSTCDITQAYWSEDGINPGEGVTITVDDGQLVYLVVVTEGCVDEILDFTHCEDDFGLCGAIPPEILSELPDDILVDADGEFVFVWNAQWFDPSDVVNNYPDYRFNVDIVGEDSRSSNIMIVTDQDYPNDGKECIEDDEGMKCVENNNGVYECEEDKNCEGLKDECDWVAELCSELACIIGEECLSSCFSDSECATGGTETCEELTGTTTWQCCSSGQTCSGDEYLTASDCSGICCSIACDGTGTTCNEGPPENDECDNHLTCYDQYVAGEVCYEESLITGLNYVDGECDLDDCGCDCITAGGNSVDCFGSDCEDDGDGDQFGTYDLRCLYYDSGGALYDDITDYDLECVLEGQAAPFYGAFSILLTLILLIGYYFYRERFK